MATPKTPPDKPEAQVARSWVETTPQPAAPTSVASTPTPAPVPAPVPQAGGSFTRQADGSLVCVEEPTAHATAVKPSQP